MEKLFRSVVGIGILMLIVSCGTTNKNIKERTLPTLDATKVLEAEALIVETQDASLDGVSNVKGAIVSGSGEGAMEGMQRVLKGTGEIITDPAGSSQGGSLVAIISILALPITIPTGAAFGAGLAHSDEEIETATTALNSAHQDHLTQLDFLDRRIVFAIQDHDIGQWECINTASQESLQCSKYNSYAILKVMPKFNFLLDEDKFNPEVTVDGDIEIIAIFESERSDNPAFTLFEAKWSYREEIGSYFNLAKDDGALLRQKMENILDKFVNTIVRDIFLTSEPQVIAEKEHGNGIFVPVLPKAKVIRVK